MPLGHCDRGSTGTPTLRSLRVAACTAPSGTVGSNHGAAHRSQRPQSAAAGSSSASCRKRIRQPSVLW